jgi:hypothetical protein
MSDDPIPEGRTRHYYVDEAGDGVLFSTRGKVLIGSEGCSRYFILGLLNVPDPTALARDLDALRASLLADPYFSRVPSMQPDQGKTAACFHAKDDVPEVRREVFRLLREHPIKFSAVVRTKQAVLEYVRRRNDSEPGYRYNPNHLYDAMMRRLFSGRLHRDRLCNIYFARRGKSDRTAAVGAALEHTQQEFFRRTGITRRSQIQVSAASPKDDACLQAVDYFLWALQRLYERGEDRYAELLWPAFRFIGDLDDTRLKLYGRYYTQKAPLTRAALEREPEI